MNDSDRQDVLAIETLLAAHAEKAPPLAHGAVAASAAPPVQVAPPIPVGTSIPEVEPPLRVLDARDIPVEDVGSSEIKVDGLKAPVAQPTSKWGKRAAIAALALLGATAAAGWQQYGDQAKAMAASWAPPFVLAALPSSAGPAAAEQPGVAAVQSGAAEQAAAAEQATPAVITATPPAGEPGTLQSMAQDLAAMGQQVEELKATVAQLKAGQAQLARELAKNSEARMPESRTSEARTSEAKAAEIRPAESSLRPKVSALTTTPAPQRPVAPPPVRKPKPVVSATYPPIHAAPPVNAAPIASPQAATALPPPPQSQAIADDGEPVVRPPMPLR
jgi:hypothetical protein